MVTINYQGEWEEAKSNPKDMKQIKRYVDDWLETLAINRILGAPNPDLPSIPQAVASELQESDELNLSTARKR